LTPEQRADPVKLLSEFPTLFSASLDSIHIVKSTSKSIPMPSRCTLIPTRSLTTTRRCFDTRSTNLSRSVSLNPVVPPIGLRRLLLSPRKTAECALSPTSVP
jgi:hypothetical protein